MKILKIFLAVLPLLAIFGCGPSNTIRLLTPPPQSVSTLPTPNAPTVSVVNFTDSRLDPAAIGARRDGSAFITSGDVPMWISRALADELAQNGIRITYALDPDQARTSNPQYLVTGVVEEAWIKENSSTSLTVSMRVNCTLANRSGKIWTESCNTSQTRTLLPTGGAADELLLSTLKDLVKPLAQKIIQTIEAKK